MDDRYDRWYLHGVVRFYLSSFTVDLDQSKLLLLKVIEQSIRDYIAFRGSTLVAERRIWEEANDFLFDDSYYFHWGDLEINLDDALTMLNLEISWLRANIKKRAGE